MMSSIQDNTDNLVTLDYTTATAMINANQQVFLTAEEIGSAGFELPTINYQHYNGHKYRYCYGSGVFEKGFFANSVWFIH